LFFKKKYDLKLILFIFHHSQIADNMESTTATKKKSKKKERVPRLSIINQQTVLDSVEHEGTERGTREVYTVIKNSSFDIVVGYNVPIRYNSINIQLCYDEDGQHSVSGGGKNCITYTIVKNEEDHEFIVKAKICVLSSQHHGFLFRLLISATTKRGEELKVTSYPIRCVSRKPDTGDTENGEKSKKRKASSSDLILEEVKRLREDVKKTSELQDFTLETGLPRRKLHRIFSSMGALYSNHLNTKDQNTFIDLITTDEKIKPLLNAIIEKSC